LGTDSGEGGQAPSIVFIDEIDAVGTKRYDSTSGGEREIQRTMLELLNQVTTAPPLFLYAKFSLPLHHRTFLE
jgi:SpoVK/Ycf46/Vps4 family AAA+-type ATPase